MRLVQFTADGASRVGARRNGSVVDLEAAGDAVGTPLPNSMVDLLSDPGWRETVEEVVAEVGDGPAVHDAADVELDAPVTGPEKIVCVGLNYVEHAEESDEDTPDSPVLFSKFPSAITGPGSEIRWDTELTNEVDFEAELAAVVGKTARRIDRDEAKEHVAGYTVANDVSARDLQFADDQWVRGKTLDTFCPLGPDLVTEDELGDPHDLDIYTDVNGERLQDSNTQHMVFDVYDLVSFCSQAFTLNPGDLILTGTPPGVGAFREPPIYLEDGDEVTVGVEGIGDLTNTCANP